MPKPKKSNTPGLDLLDWSANHFEFRDWNFTHNTDIKSIRYDLKRDWTNKLSYRIKQAFWWLLAPRPDWIKKLDSDRTFFQHLTSRVFMFFHCLKRDNNLPDGWLDDGNIIVYWCETGQYLNLMQPTVGALLVNFLREDPTNPHAKLISAEIERLYAKREGHDYE